MRLRKITEKGREAAHQRHTPWPLAWAWLAALCLPVQAEGVLKVEWDADGRYRQSARVVKGQAVEACVVLGDATPVAWRFESDQALDFNIHRHEGKKVLYLAMAKAGTQGAGELKPDKPEHYCWMWQARGAKPVQLTLELQRR